MVMRVNSTFAMVLFAMAGLGMLYLAYEILRHDRTARRR
jgi:hypothetical protein